MLAPPVADKSRCRIALFLPQAWYGGMERNAWALAELLSGLRAPDGRPIEVVIGLRGDGRYDWEALEAQARASSGRIAVRRLKWVQRSGEAVNAMFGDGTVPPGVQRASLPFDGLYNFLDSDAWVVFATTYEGYVPAVRPTAVYSADHIHRYVPLPTSHLTPALIEQNDDTLLYWRRARCVFSTTPGTVSDSIGYAGVAASRALLLPTLVDPLAGVSTPAPRPPGDYILWVTNTSPHKNHAKALEALKIYWTEFGGNLDVVVCGSLVETLKPGSRSTHALTVGLEKGAGWSHRVRILGHVDDEAFFDLVAGSAFIWHNAIIDNGTFVAFDAARADRRVVSSDYPAMRYLTERYGIDTSWFPASDPAAAAQALLHAEREVRAGRKPNHRLKADDPAERATAYQHMIEMLLQP